MSQHYEYDSIIKSLQKKVVELTQSAQEWEIEISPSINFDINKMPELKIVISRISNGKKYVATFYYLYEQIKGAYPDFSIITDDIIDSIINTHVRPMLKEKLQKKQIISFIEKTYAQGLANEKIENS